MPVKIKKEVIYSVSEVAEKLNVTTASVRNYLIKGSLKGQKIMDRWLILEEDLNKFMQDCVERALKKVKA